MDELYIVSFCYKLFKFSVQFVEKRNVLKDVRKYGAQLERDINNGDIPLTHKLLYPLKESLEQLPQTGKVNQAISLYYWACCYYVEKEYDKSKAKLYKLNEVSTLFFNKRKVKEIQEKGNRLLMKIRRNEQKAVYDRKKKRMRVIILSWTIFIILTCMLCMIIF